MPDNIESRIDFIIQQQAQFATDMQLLKERQAESQHMISQLVDVTMSLARHGEDADRRLMRLGEETDRRFKETGELIRELREAQAHSDSRLDALIDTVDKLVRRNGS